MGAATQLVDVGERVVKVAAQAPLRLGACQVSLGET